MSDLVRDLKYSLRMLTKNPVFTAAAVLTLALGIGLNAATFSAVHGILLKPLSGATDVDRLVQLYRHWEGMEYGSNSIPHYQDLRDRTDEAFTDVAAWNFVDMALSVDGRSERLIGMMASANFFQTYGVRPAMGRFFIPGEEDRSPGAHPVAVLGHGFWQSRFGSDPGVVGRTLLLNGHAFEVVGVAPAEFKGPVNFAAAPIYVPIMMAREISPGSSWLESRGNNMMNVIARMRDDRSLDQSRQVLDATLLSLRDEYPDSYARQVGTTMVPQMEAGIHPTFRAAQVGMSSVIMAVVTLLLIIACVNVANLFLARARERRREMGIRLSIGASRGRIIRQLLTESLLFSVLAGLAGLGLARVAVGLLGRIRPPMDGPWEFGIEMDTTVLLFTLFVSLMAGFIFGLAPALQAANPDTVAAIKGEGDDGAGRSRMSKGLVVFQMALSLVLLVSSGLFLRSLQGATDIDPGFDEPRNLVVASMDPGLQGYDEERSRQFLDRILTDVAALPDVRVAGLSNWLPLGLSTSDRGIEVPGYEFTEGERRSIHYALVTEGFVETMGMNVVEGRSFTRQDDAEGPPVIMVNQRFADRFWPNQPAVGKIVRTAGEEREVIGVIETGKVRSLGEEPTELMLLPQRELFRSGMTVVARTPANPEAVLRSIQEMVRGMDPDLPVFDVRTMEDHMGVALLPARLGGSVLGLFGILGLVLAAVGIYGVMAYSVSQRGREIGIRVALGADRSRVLRLVVGEGMKLTVVGMVLGLAAAAGAAGLVRGLLYNVSAMDPVAFVGVPLLLVAVAAMAVYFPARRAAATEPMRALKVD